MPRWLRALLLAMVLGAVLVVVGVEIGGRILTQRYAEAELRDAGVAGGVEVTVGSAWWRPSVIPALLTGDLDRVAVRLEDAELYSMPVREADYVLEDLSVDVSLGDRTVTATSLGAGSFRLVVDPSEIGRLLGADTVVEGGKVLIGPDRDPAELTVRGRELVVTSAALSATGGSTSMQVVDPQLLPCSPEVRVVGRYVELACTGDHLPGILEQTIGMSGVADVPAPPAELEPPATMEITTTTTPPTTPPTTAVPQTAPPETAPADTAPPDTTPEGGNDGGG